MPPRRTRTRRPPSAASLVVVAALAGCGGGDGPHARRADVAPLIALAHRIPGEAPCAQGRDIRALRARASTLLNAGRVPAALQEPLSSGVNALVEEAPACLPSVTPADASPRTVVTPTPRAHGDGGRKAPHGHGKGRKKK